MTGRASFGGAAKTSNYEVGYRRPPAHTRFRKGVSGNPRGRPRESARSPARSHLVEDAFLKATNEPIDIALNGRRVRVPRIEALAHQLMTQALKGDTRAARLLVDVLKHLKSDQEGQLTHEEWLELLDEQPKEPEGILVRFVSPDGTIRDSVSKPMAASSGTSDGG